MEDESSSRSVPKALRKIGAPRARLVSVLGRRSYRHDGRIRHVAVSCDDAYVLTFEEYAPRVRVWSARTGARVKSLRGKHLACLATPRDALVADGDDLVRYSLPDGVELGRFPCAVPYEGLSVSADGAWALDAERGFLHLASGRAVRPTRHGPASLVCCFSARGDFAVALDDGGALVRYALGDAVSGDATRLYPLAAPAGEAFELALSPDDRRVFVRSSRGLLAYDLASGRATVDGALGYEVSGGPPSQPLAVGARYVALGTSAGVELFDVARTRPTRVLAVEPPTRLCWSRSGNVLWLSRNDDWSFAPDGDCLEAFDARTGARVAPRDSGHRNRVTAIAVTRPSGAEHDLVATGASDRSVKLWDLGGAPRPRRTLEPVRFWVERLAFDADRRLLCVTELEADGAGGDAVVYRVESGDAAFDLSRARGLDGTTSAHARLAPGGAALVRVVESYRGDFDGQRLEVRALGAGAAVTRLACWRGRETGGDGCVGVEWLDDGSRVLVATPSCATIVDVQGDRVVSRRAFSGQRVRAFVPLDGARALVVTDHPAAIRVMSLEPGAVEPAPPLDESARLATPVVLAASPTRRHFAVATHAGCHVVDLRSGRAVARLAFANNAGAATALAFTTDGAQLLVGTRRGVVLVFALALKG